MNYSLIIAKLRDYGADVDGALERFIDDEQLFCECLYTFNNDASFEQLENAMKAKDYDEAFIAAHTLKGVAGNMGLTPLYNSVCTLVEALRAHEYGSISYKYEDFSHHRKRFEKLLKEAGDEEAGETEK